MDFVGSRLRPSGAPEFAHRAHVDLFQQPVALGLTPGHETPLKQVLILPQKTGTAVYVPLPPAAVKALGLLEGDSEHFFTSGKAKAQTARANWSRYLDTVFTLAKVKDAHSHRFRDTFAVCCSKMACRSRTFPCCSAIRRFGSPSGITSRG